MADCTTGENDILRVHPVRLIPIPQPDYYQAVAIFSDVLMIPLTLLHWLGESVTT